MGATILPSTHTQTTSTCAPKLVLKFNMSPNAFSFKIIRPSFLKNICEDTTIHHSSSPSTCTLLSIRAITWCHGAPVHHFLVQLIEKMITSLCRTGIDKQGSSWPEVAQGCSPTLPSPWQSGSTSQYHLSPYDNVLMIHR